MAILLYNDEGPDFYLRDDYKLVADVTENSTTVAFYTNGDMWVAYACTPTSRIFQDSKIGFVIAQVQELFNGGKPKALRAALAQVAEAYPQLLDKIYIVL